MWRPPGRIRNFTCLQDILLTLTVHIPESNLKVGYVKITETESTQGDPSGVTHPSTVCSDLPDRVENRKRKIFPFSFLNRFCYPWNWQAKDFPIVFGSQIQTVPILDTNSTYTYFGIVFLKTSLSLSRVCRLLSRQTDPHCRFYSTVTTLEFLSYAVFNKSLKPNDSIGPSLVLCLIHCRSPTPSVFYFALQNWSSTWRSFSSRQTTPYPHLRQYSDRRPSHPH